VLIQLSTLTQSPDYAPALSGVTALYTPNRFYYLCSHPVPSPGKLTRLLSRFQTDSLDCGQRPFTKAPKTRPIPKFHPYAPSAGAPPQRRHSPPVICRPKLNGVRPNTPNQKPVWRNSISSLFRTTIRPSQSSSESHFTTPSEHGSSSPTPCPPPRPLADSAPREAAPARDGGLSESPASSAHFQTPSHSPGGSASMENDGLGSPSAGATPGLRPLVLTVEMVLINRSTRIRTKLDYIRRLSFFFHDHCAACWTLTGRSWPADHEPFNICRTRMHPELITTATASPEFAAMQPAFHARATCSRCWLPQIAIDGRPYNRTVNHPTSGPGCTHPRPDALKHVAWVVYSTPALLRLFRRDFVDLRVPQSITAAQWEAWLALERCGMTHLGHLVFWLIRIYGCIQERSSLDLYE
jgi:hypothetical protein